jgi:hypothetical protein
VSVSLGFIALGFSLILGVQVTLEYHQSPLFAMSFHATRTVVGRSVYVGNWP